MTPHALRRMKHSPPPPPDPLRESRLGLVLWVVLAAALALSLVLPLLRGLP